MNGEKLIFVSFQDFKEVSSISVNNPLAIDYKQEGSFHYLVVNTSKETKQIEIKMAGVDGQNLLLL